MSKGACKSDVKDFYRAGIRGAACTGTFSDPAGEILSIGRDGLADVFDLVHVHSEVPVRGNQPRAVLNPLMVLLYPLDVGATDESGLFGAESQTRKISRPCRSH